MMVALPQPLRLGLATLSVVALAQCSQSPLNSPTSPTSAVAASAGGHVVSGPIGSESDGTPTLEFLQICKTADSNVSGTFTLSSADPTTYLSSLTVAPGKCYVAAIIGGTGAPVTVTETSAGLQSATFNKVEEVNGSLVYTSGAFTNGGSVLIAGKHGATLTFKNVVEEPPGGQGCTPGYWRQEHHYDSWTGYAPGADFDATFGVNFFNPNVTLGVAVTLGGGGTNALARHGVAALLNAASGGVNYAYTTSQVIAIVRGTGAYAGLSVEARKNLLAAANEAGCPLN